MSITVLTDASVTYNSVDLSDHVESVIVDMSSEEVDTTAMGATARNSQPGLRADSITINFFQDFDAAKVDATIVAQQGSATGATMVVKPTSAAVSSSNPSYTATMSPFSYMPLNGKVGDASQTSTTFKCVGGSKIVRATT